MDTKKSLLLNGLAIVLGAVMVLAGLFFAWGGVRLMWLGGTWYFGLIGLALIVSGVLIVLRHLTGIWLYSAAFVLTVVWALFDAGFHFWPLVSRLVAPAVLLILVLLTTPLMRETVREQRRYSLFGAGGIAIALVLTLIYAFLPHAIIPASGVAPARAEVTDSGDWNVYGKDGAATRFAAIGQITPENVKSLKVAWTFRTGDIPLSPTGFGAEDQNTPLQVGNTLYICTAHNIVISIDATTGKEKWRYDSQAKAPQWQRCRGVAYHDAILAPTNIPRPAAICERRIIMTTVDDRLIALDAETGKPCPTFGDKGTVNLAADIGPIKPGFYTQTSAPLVAGNLIVVGGRVADNVEVGEPGGVVRAFDVNSGALIWAWDIGNPATTKLPPKGQTYTRATPNVWAGMTYDDKLGLVYLPTGNTTPDAWGGERTANDDKYSSSIVALDVKTGRPRWSFQTVHHDLWDYDVPAQPTLVDLADGTPALVQVTKAGQIFLINRVTGQPIADVEERKVAVGNARGERYSQTQPFSVGMPSIGAQTLKESDMWGATPFDQMLCRIQFKQMRYDGAFTAPGEDLSLQWPGSLGGMNWGGVSIDKSTNYMYVNDMRLGLWTKFIPREQVKGGSGKGTEMGLSSQDGTPYMSMRNRFLSVLQIPCQKPPYGTMTAIDLNTRKVAWQVPMGTVQDTGPFGIKMLAPIPIGMPTLGGALATKTGLVFFAGTQDYYLRALSGTTGKELWKARMPVGSQGTPMSYVSPVDGKQYIVVTAGGARQSPDRGDYVIAYRLP
ncbi:MAG: membrane-bound PQQ-dependent dehydrogenase, glucose/quinate/shikimate family [Asticcacaulis sp.]|uniref:membrane-bound PQQ-dependent dehydrogenase, glucose/quinate/shikimate family n=1 Tax=Asticcacaulis sp. TaxID=1872648 RepID=UPI0039E4847D